MLKDKLKKLLAQFLKFGFVGGLSTVVSLGIYYSLILIGADYIPATVAGYLLSSLMSYFLNRVWVFRAEGTGIASSTVRYYVVYLASFLINLGGIYLLVDVLDLSRYLAPLLIVCVTVPFNFVFSRFWIFRQCATSLERR